MAFILKREIARSAESQCWGWGCSMSLKKGECGIETALTRAQAVTSVATLSLEKQ